MRYSLTVIAAVLLSATSLFAQTSSSGPSPSLLLPQPVHVNGQVVGEDGKPIAGAEVLHADSKQEIATDSNGHTEFDTVAPSFVLQRPGYESAWIQTKDASSFHAVMRKLPHGPAFPVCTAANLASKIPGWNGIFQIPKAEGIHASSERADVDYFARAIQVKSRRRNVALEQGRGGMWGWANPDDQRLWRAVHYREISYEFHESLPIVDSRLELPDGTCERRIGIFSETLWYYSIRCDSALPLDKLLDSACLVPNAWEHSHKD